MTVNIKSLELINSNMFFFIDEETDHSGKVETRIPCLLWFLWAI